MRLTNYIDVLGMRVDMVQIPDVIAMMEKWITDGGSGNYIVISNANDALASRKDIRVREAVNRSSLSVPDGISMVLLGRMNSYPLKRRVYGPDLMRDFLTKTYDNGYSHFFYGSTPRTLDLMAERLNLSLPNIRISGFYSPPFGPITQAEDEKIIETINRASPDVLWVGLGCPKQQLWMYEHRDKLRVPVMVGVGAAFDFLAGTKAQAPKWIQSFGLEWLFRLIAEPRRLAKRYILGYSLFIGLICREFFHGRLLNKNNKDIKSNV